MIVLDASVVVKWFSEEEFTEKALELRERVKNG
jgi:predicted nucleic acid-binding protein